MLTHWYLDACDAAAAGSGMKPLLYWLDAVQRVWLREYSKVKPEYPCVSTFDTALEDGWRGDPKVCVLGMPGPCEHEKCGKIKGSALMCT